MTADMPPDKLAALLALAEEVGRLDGEATPKPWRMREGWSPNGDAGDSDPWCSVDGPTEKPLYGVARPADIAAVHEGYHLEQMLPNGLLIATYRTAAPALAAFVRAVGPALVEWQAARTALNRVHASIKDSEAVAKWAETMESLRLPRQRLLLAETALLAALPEVTP